MAVLSHPDGQRGAFLPVAPEHLRSIEVSHKITVSHQQRVRGPPGQQRERACRTQRLLFFEVADLAAEP